MAARGTYAKAEVTKRIAEAFGSQYLGEFDKKLYLSMREGGEEVQIAITLTCPKVLVQTSSNDVMETGKEEDVVEVKATSSDFSANERENIERLMRELGL